MIKVEMINVCNFEAAIRGMRQPLESHAKSDSYWTHIENPETMNEAPFQYFVGANDLDLMRRLFWGGTEHRKYMRQIFVSMDITAPLYWWKEFDTYKIGTTANSTSTMHKIHAKPFSREFFSCERMSEDALSCLDFVISVLENKRQKFLETNDRQCWDDMIQLLPSSFNQTRTVTLNYENVVNMIRQRTNHKLPEWRELVDILRGLPYIEDIITQKTEEN
jgi:hypothetical protein